ncbi:MAG TPA: MFS transporter [Nitrososphaerales archaeon]|nr:MFS transporter [Nitrososphaerales archaeon]
MRTTRHSDSIVSGRSVATLVAARAVYAINWLNVGAIYYLMEADLKGGVSGLGTLTSSFYLGIGLFQVPGGILAAKWGPKRVVTIGILISSLSAIGVSFTSSIPEAAVLRFFVGAGMAFVFSPSIVIAASYLGHHRSGINVGLFNSAYSVGGIFGLFGWTIIATVTGWRPSIVLSGVLGVITGIMVLFLVPNEHTLSFKVDTARLTNIIKDKSLILLGVGTLSLTTGNNLIGAFMAYYLHDSLGIAPSLAALVAAIVVAMPIFSALIGGREYDRIKKPKLLMLVTDFGIAGALLICAVHSLNAAIIGCTLAGIIFGIGLTTAFAAAKDLNREPKEYDTLAISWVNSLSLFGNFGPPLVFSYLAVSSGYSTAWLGGSGIVILLLIPLFFLSEGIVRKSA